MLWFTGLVLEYSCRRAHKYKTRIEVTDTDTKLGYFGTELITVVKSFTVQALGSPVLIYSELPSRFVLLVLSTIFGYVIGCMECNALAFWGHS